MLKSIQDIFELRARCVSSEGNIPETLIHGELFDNFQIIAG